MPLGNCKAGAAVFRNADINIKPKTFKYAIAGTPRRTSRSTLCAVEPTIFYDVDNSARIAREEIFGPVATVIPFENEKDALRIANDTPFGLAAAVWSPVFTGSRLRSGSHLFKTEGAFDPKLPKTPF